MVMFGKEQEENSEHAKFMRQRNQLGLLITQFMDDNRVNPYVLLGMIEEIKQKVMGSMGKYEDHVKGSPKGSPKSAMSFTTDGTGDGFEVVESQCYAVSKTTGEMIPLAEFCKENDLDLEETQAKLAQNIKEHLAKEGAPGKGPISFKENMKKAVDDTTSELHKKLKKHLRDGEKGDAPAE